MHYKKIKIHLFSLICMFFLLGCFASNKKTRVILDTDANNELDDQHAIAYMLFNRDYFQVEGITVNRTFNGGDIEKHYEEAERIVKLCSLYSEIKIHRGANDSFEEITTNFNLNDFDGHKAVDFIIAEAKKTSNDKLVLLPVGKLTNIALAIYKDPSIISKIRVVWLGSNYPEPGEYNQVNDPSSLQYILNTNVHFEIVTVRYGKPSGTDAVRALLSDIEKRMPGKGPNISEVVRGRHGNYFSNFGDYSVNLFQNIELDGNTPSRALFDMAAIAIVKNPSWAKSKKIPSPELIDGKWFERPQNNRTITIWEEFDKKLILEDFYESMDNYSLSETK